MGDSTETFFQSWWVFFSQKKNFFMVRLIKQCAWTRLAQEIVGPPATKLSTDAQRGKWPLEHPWSQPLLRQGQLEPVVWVQLDF